MAKKLTKQELKMLEFSNAITSEQDTKRIKLNLKENIKNEED